MHFIWCTFLYLQTSKNKHKKIVESGVKGWILYEISHRAHQCVHFWSHLSLCSPASAMPSMSRCSQPTIWMGSLASQWPLVYNIPEEKRYCDHFKQYINPVNNPTYVASSWPGAKGHCYGLLCTLFLWNPTTLFPQSIKSYSLANPWIFIEQWLHTKQEAKVFPEASSHLFWGEGEGLCPCFLGFPIKPRGKSPNHGYEKTTDCLVGYAGNVGLERKRNSSNFAYQT